MNKTALVTVGTTDFDRLVDTVITEEVIRSLLDLDIVRLIVQFGRGDCDPEKLWSTRISDRLKNRIALEAYRYKPSLSQDVDRSDIVIGHAGAGTTLECLEAGKLLLVVTNDTLQDQHQSELAGRFSELGYLHFCDPERLPSLVAGIANNSLPELQPYTPGEPKLFADWFVGELFHQ